jgi:hypothetical protein
MRIKGDNEVISMACKLFNGTNGFGEQSIWLEQMDDKSRIGIKYKDPSIVKEMQEVGLVKIEDEKEVVEEGRFIFPTNIKRFHRFLISFKRKDIIDFVMKNKTFRWGSLIIKPNANFEYDNVKSDKKFYFNTQIRCFLGYIFLLDSVSYEEFGELFGKTISTNEGQTMSEIIRKIKNKSVKELIKFGMDEKQANRIFHPNRGKGYFLESFD